MKNEPFYNSSRKSFPNIQEAIKNFDITIEFCLDTAQKFLNKKLAEDGFYLVSQNKIQKIMIKEDFEEKQTVSGSRCYVEVITVAEIQKK